MHGFYGRGLRVHLGDGSSEVFRLTEDDLSMLGGKGLGTVLLAREAPQGVDPLAPENPLVFTTGPLAGTAMMGVSRYGVFSKSPLTKAYSESYSGGHVAPVIKATGFDAIILSGASREPVYITITPEGAEVQPAHTLWGLDAYKTEDRLIQSAPEGAQAIVIGPAGENLVKYACLQNNHWRSAGRTGLGAVLGAKKVKGIVFSGDRTADVAAPEELAKFTRVLVDRGRDDAGVRGYQRFGTPNLVAPLNAVGTFPTRYWHKGRLDGWESLSAQYMVDNLGARPKACHRCFLACGKLVTVADGPHTGLTIEGPEYETIYAFGGLCEITDLREIAHLNDLCDRLGMDTITAGNVVSFVMEAASIGGRVADLPVIAYGDAAGAAELIKDIAYRRGIGDLLAEGTKAIAEHWGLQDLAIHVKGLEPAGYDPRVLKGMALAYATSARGACHLRSTFYKAELSGQLEGKDLEARTALFTEWEDRLALFDTLILCRFFRDLIQWEQLAELVKYSVGQDLDKSGLRRIAASVVDATRRFNYREGLRAVDDRLPRRFFTEALPETGGIVDEADHQLMMKYYYALRGWDAEGRPPA